MKINKKHLNREYFNPMLIRVQSSGPRIIYNFDMLTTTHALNELLLY